MEVRDELRKSQNASANGNIKPTHRHVFISTGYSKGDPQKHPGMDYVFTDNAEASAVVLNNKYGVNKTDLLGTEKLPFTGDVKINVSDVRKTNSAGIRTDSNGNISQNAYGIVVKKYQHDANGKFVAQDGCFKDTDSDFEMFKRFNNIIFEKLEQS
nr:MAG TPA: hypothetical protein [Caudoviricetes sp.]